MLGANAPLSVNQNGLRKAGEWIEGRPLLCFSDCDLIPYGMVLHEFLDRIIIAVYCNGQHSKAFIFVLAVHSVEDRHLFAAGHAPGGPEIESHNFTFK